MDIHLLRALDLAPKVICIEYNSKFPAHVVKAPVRRDDYVWRNTDYMGASLAAIDVAARAKAFRLVATNITGSNAFLVRSDLAEGRFDASLNLAELYNPPRYHLTFDHFGRHVGHPADFGPYEDMA